MAIGSYIGVDGIARKNKAIYVGANGFVDSFLKNSSFQGTTDWTINSSYYSFSFIEDYTKFITTTVAAVGNGSYRAFQQNLSTRITGSTADTAQKIYCCARVRGYSTNTGYPRIYYSAYPTGASDYTSYNLFNTATGIDADIELNDDQWHTVGRLFTTYDSATGNSYELYRASGAIYPPSDTVAAKVGDKFDIKEFCFFNLTEIYGRGNEPTEAWCLANIVPNGSRADLPNITNIARKVRKVYVGDSSGKARLCYAVASEADLVDFEYTINNDGTYTLTDWAGTTNGVNGTEIIIPDGQNIIL